MSEREKERERKDILGSRDGESEEEEGTGKIKNNSIDDGHSCHPRLMICGHPRLVFFPPPPPTSPSASHPSLFTLLVNHLSTNKRLSSTCILVMDIMMVTRVYDSCWYNEMVGRRIERGRERERRKSRERR